MGDASWNCFSGLEPWMGFALGALAIFGFLIWPKLVDLLREKPEDRIAPKGTRPAHAAIITELRQSRAVVTAMRGEMSAMSTKIDNTRDDVHEMRGDVKDVRDRVSRLEATTDHMGKQINETRTDTKQIMLDTQQSRDLFTRIRSDIAEAQQNRAKGEKTWQTAVGDD